MTDSIKKLLETGDSMEIYDYIVNNAELGIENIDRLVERLRQIDSSGQFLASTARYLHAVNPELYKDVLPSLLEGAIENDKERKYIGALLEALWGKGYLDRAEELRDTDNLFRKIYQRIYLRSI